MIDDELHFKAASILTALRSTDFSNRDPITKELERSHHICASLESIAILQYDQLWRDQACLKAISPSSISTFLAKPTNTSTI